MQSNTSEALSDIEERLEDPGATFDYTQIRAKASNGETFPIGDVRYHPYLEGEPRWTTNAYPLKFHTNIVMTTDSDGRFIDDGNRYVELFVENDYVEGYEGKLFPIKIEKVDWAKREIKDKHFGFNFRLGLSASINLDYICPAINTSFFSYGRTLRDMDWRFLTLSFGGNENLLCFGASPVSWNLGNHLPLIENFFIGPSVFLDTDNVTSYGLDLSIPF